MRAAVAELEKNPAPENPANAEIKSAARELLLSLEAAIDQFHLRLQPIYERLENFGKKLEEENNGTPKKGWSISAAAGTEFDTAAIGAAASASADEETGTAAESTGGGASSQPN